MAGNSIQPEPGATIIGKLGRYRVKKKIGSGGNGSVFTIDIVEGSELFSKSKEYVIKFLTIDNEDEKEYRKKELRFKKEIEIVISLQNDIIGIIPILDSSLDVSTKDEQLWYIMPRAQSYSPLDYSVDQRLNQMLQLGNCLSQLHKMGYAHRDIKPKNLLIYQGKMCLSDFGLVWNYDDQAEHITEVNDRLGPMAIRPPELQPIERIEGVDYRKSDVYLYAKTIWMVLNCNNRGFPGTYSRDLDEVYIDKEKYQFETAEPLHCLLEKATKHNFWERLDIDDCLIHLNDQIKVVRGEISDRVLSKWKYNEQAKRNAITFFSDEKIYNTPTAFIKILNSMANIVGLVFTEPGYEYQILPLVRAHCSQSDIFDIEVSNPYANEEKKVLEIAIEKMRMNQELYYTIYTKTSLFNDESIPIYKHLNMALQSPERLVRLNGRFEIRMDPL